MNDKKQIAVQTFNWGPCVIRLKMEDEYKKLFLEESKNNTQDYRSNLAGILEHETGYGAKSKEKLLPILIKSLVNIIHHMITMVNYLL